MDPAEERAAVQATIDRIEAASVTRPVGWLGAGLAETLNTLDYLAEAGIRYDCDWVNHDQPYRFEGRHAAFGVIALFGADQRRPRLL
jgi:peptidoglycan/xylan/chitin deacetylase (PgdA/CDA1 family)